MNPVWIDHAGRSSSPCPGSSRPRPRRPRIRRPVVSATWTDSLMILPSSRRSVRTPRRLRATELVRDRDDRGEQDHDEHRGEDEEDEREQHLDRRLLRHLLGRGLAALPHLVGHRSHDVTHRDAERLALDDRAGEERDASCVGALLQVHERLVDGQAHVLLLQRQPQLLPERPADPIGCGPHCLREAQAGLDRDDEEVDQLGQLVLDRVVALPDAPTHDVENGEPADDHGGEREENDDHGRRRCGDRQPERQDAQPGRDEHLVAEQAVG